LAFVGRSLYTFNSGDELYSIDPATGTATAVGFGNRSLDAFLGLATPDGSTLYGVTTTPGPAGSGYNLYMIDTSTGADTFDLNFGSNLLFGGIEGIAFGPQSQSPPPEPSTILLVGVGVLISAAPKIWRKA
jgi:hypothetical protein